MKKSNWRYVVLCDWKWFSLYLVVHRATQWKGRERRILRSKPRYKVELHWS